MQAGAPEVKLTAENCHRYGHVDVQIGQSNLAKCQLCGRVIYRETPPLGTRK
jgi:hypothetical protein